MRKRMTQSASVALLLLLGCGAPEVREDQLPLLRSIRSLANPSSPGFHCEGDDTVMGCACIEGVPADDYWTCEGLKEWCDFFEPGKFSCKDGICSCGVVLATALESTSPPAAPSKSPTGTDLEAAVDSRELRGLASAPPTAFAGTLNYTCAGDGKSKACTCKKGSTDLATTCKGMDKICEGAVGKEMECKPDGWCSCSNSS